MKILNMNNSMQDFLIGILEKNFHIDISDDPDFVIYGTHGYEQYKYDCIRIYIGGENKIPDFNECDYAISFFDLCFGDRYYRCELFNMFEYLNDTLLGCEKHKKEKQLDNLKFCNYVVSNANCIPERKQFLDLVNTYKRVDSGGRYMNNVGGPVANKLEFQKKYKFSIVFENSSSKNYLTEKLPQAFAAQTIPIYYGDPCVGDIFNSKSFINCHEYSSFEEVLQRIKEIDENDEVAKQILSEPMLVDENFVQKRLVGLEKFFEDIFNQDKDNAFRREHVLSRKVELYKLRNIKMERSFAGRILRKFF